VSVAAGIVLFEAVRQRRAGRGQAGRGEAGPKEGASRAGGREKGV